MASRKVNIDISTRADTSGAQQAAASMDKLDAASNRAATGAEVTSKGVSRVGQVATSAGYQVQDFAVQVAGGTSALTAMAQQAPQFLGVFGPGGAIAGALIAVGAIAAKVFMGMRDDSAATAEQAALLADAIEKIGENAEKAVANDVDFGLAQIDAATTSANNLIGAFDGVAAAANADYLAGLTNAEKLRQAELDIRRLRGEQVSELENIAARTEAEAAKRQELARQEIEAQREIEAQAQQALANEQEKLRREQEFKAEKEAELVRENKRLEQLREQRDILKEIKEKGYFQITAQDVATLGMEPGTTSTQARDEAARRLEKDIAPQIRLVEGTIAGLEQQGKVISESISQVAAGIESLAIKAAAATEAVAIAIPEIEKSFQTETIVAQVETIKELATQAATDVQGIIDTVKPANASEAAALEALKPMVTDKKITADETLRVSQLLATLDGSIRTQMGSAAANTDTLIKTVAEMQRRLDSQKRQIDALQSNARAAGG